MEVNERRVPIGSPARYYALFKSCDVKDGCLLVGSFGNGATPEEAIANYAPKIALRTLVYKAFSKNERKEMKVPRLVSC